MSDFDDLAALRAAAHAVRESVGALVQHIEAVLPAKPASKKRQPADLVEGKDLRRAWDDAHHHRRAMPADKEARSRQGMNTVATPINPLGKKSS